MRKFFRRSYTHGDVSYGVPSDSYNSLIPHLLRFLLYYLESVVGTSHDTQYCTYLVAVFASETSFPFNIYYVLYLKVEEERYVHSTNLSNTRLTTYSKNLWLDHARVCMCYGGLMITVAHSPSRYASD